MLSLAYVSFFFTPHSEPHEGRIVLLFSFTAHALIRDQYMCIAVSGIHFCLRKKGSVSKMILRVKA